MLQSTTQTTTQSTFQSTSELTIETIFQSIEKPILRLCLNDFHLDTSTLLPTSKSTNLKSLLASKGPTVRTTLPRVPGTVATPSGTLGKSD